MPFYGFDPATYPLNTNEWAFPVCEIFHVIGFALLISTIFMVDLRLLGLGMRRQTAAEILEDTAPWSLLGLVLVLISGPLILFSDPAMYFNKPIFWMKMTVLFVAILHNWTIHRSVAKAPNSSMGPLVAIISILLWASLPAFGIFIAFV